MKKYIFLFSILSLLFSCQQNDVLTEEMGLVKLGLSLSDDVVVKSRAEVPSEEVEKMKQNCKIRIFHNDNLIKRFRNWNDIPAEGLLFTVGTGYKITVEAGEQIPASHDSKYYEGVQEFAVERNDVETVNVNCNVANTLVKVEFAPEWDNFLAEAHVVVGVKGGELTYTWGAENKLGYYNVPVDAPELTYTFSGKTVNDKAFSYEGKIQNPLKSTQYTLTFSPKEGEPSVDYDGGGFFKLTVSDAPLYTTEVESPIYLKPRFEARNNGQVIDMKSPWIPGVLDVIQPTFYVRATTELKEATVSSPLFTDMGLSSETVDLLTTDIVKISELYGHGIAFGVSEDKKTVKMVFNKPLNSYLGNTPKYDILFHAVDSYDAVDEGNQALVGDLTFQLQMIDLNIKAIETPWYEIWSTSAVVYGAKFPGKNPESEVVFQYRKKDGVDTWKNVAAVLQEDGINYKSAKITGLKPATTYEYQFVETGKEVFGLFEFTTESGKQFPNASFENWSDDGKVRRIYEPGGKMFWDSGNPGATIAGPNITTESSEFKNTGTYSAKMFTNSVFGVLAAGNMFTGQFLRTEGTNGVLGLGRPWDARPVAIEGYVRYVPASGVDTKKIPSDIANTIKNGVDNGIIYAAIGDWAGKEGWPVIVKTSDPKNGLFSTKPGTYTGDGIIAYGEYLMTEQTPAGDGMVKFRINLEYRSYERMPKSIILVAASSKYGDYFVGAKGSTMWLDDLTVVYE